MIGSGNQKKVDSKTARHWVITHRHVNAGRQRKQRLLLTKHGWLKKPYLRNLAGSW
jgi:hypothetical protein